MQQSVRTETSYSALLHGPDTPPFHPESSWDFSAGERLSARTHGNFPLNGMTVKDPASLNGCAGAPSHFVPQNFLLEQMKTEQKLPKNNITLEAAAAMKQKSCYPNVELRIQLPISYQKENDCIPHEAKSGQSLHRSQQHLCNQAAAKKPHFQPFEGGLAPLPNNGKNFMQSFQCARNSNSDKKDVDNAHPQPHKAIAEKSYLKQQDGMALPLRAMPTGQIIGSFGPQHFSAENYMHSHGSMSAVGGSQMYHGPGSRASHNSCGMRAWVDGYPSMQHTPYLPYGSGHVQTGAIYHAPDNWQTSSIEAMADTYSHYHPEGYYSCHNNFSSMGESKNVALPLFVNYDHHNEEPHAYLPSANQFLPRSRATVNGGDHIRTSNKNFTVAVHANQKNPEKLVMAGGQDPQQCEDTREVLHVSQSVNGSKNCEGDAKIHNANRDKDNISDEKDVELMGPRMKKLKECSEAAACRIKSCPLSAKSSPQDGPPSSINVTNLSCTDGTSWHNQNFSDVEGGSFHPSVNDHGSQVLSQGCYYGMRSDNQQGDSSELITRMSHGSGIPYRLWPQVATEVEISPNYVPGDMLYREHFRSPSSMYHPASGLGLSQSDPEPQMSYFSGAQPIQKCEANHHFIPEGNYDGYRDEWSSARSNTSLNVAQDQSLTENPMRQSGGRVQVASHPGAYPLLNAPTFHQVPSPGVAAKSAVPRNRLPSGSSTQECIDSRSTMAKPSKNDEGAGPMSMPNLTYHDTYQYAYGIHGQNYSSAFNKDERFTSSFHSEANQFRPSYSPTSPFTSQLEPSFQMRELKSFEHSEAGSLQTSSQTVGFGRPGLSRFHPPRPFHGPSLHFQGDNGRVATVPTDNGSLPDMSGGAKAVTLQPVSYQAGTRYIVERSLLCPASCESDVMTCGSTLPEHTQVHRQHFFSPESGNMSKQQPGSTLLYAHAAHKVPPKSIASETHPSSITVGSHVSGDPRQILPESETLIPSYTSEYPKPLASGKNFGLANKDQPLPPGQCNDNVGRGCPTLIDTEAIVSEKASSQQVPQLAFRVNHRVAPVMQQRKRKKSVPCLLPWHVLAFQTKCQLPSLGKAELMWTTATNRLVDKDGGRELSDMSILKAEGRLKLTTQLTQQIFSPLPSGLMHGRQLVSLECGVYNLSKSTLAEACRLLAAANRENESTEETADMKAMVSNRVTRMWNMGKEIAMIQLVERGMERVKHLKFELERLDHSISVLKVRGKSHELERLSIVHRLGKHHGAEFIMSLSENRLTADTVTNVNTSNRKIPPQRYVIAVPMPRMLPEGARCLSL